MNFVRNLFGKAQQEEVAAPSAKDLQEAKKVFFEYSCNGLHMAQNDVNFSKYHISEEQQATWRDEFIAYWRSQLSTDDMTAVQKLREADAVEALPDLLARVDQGDSYARLRIAEGIWALSYRVKDKALRKQAKATAVRSAQAILAQPIEVSERHKIEIARLGGSSPEEYITAFAKNVV
jgi:hypothetical protein